MNTFNHVTRWVVVAWCLIFSGIADAQSNQQAKQALSLQINPISGRARSDGPIGIIAKFKWTGGELLEGRLHLSLQSSHERLAEVRTHELAIAHGEQAYQFYLPGSAHDGMSEDSVLKAVFESSTKDINLGRFPLRLPVRNERRFVIGVPYPSQWGAGDRHADLIRRMQIERYRKNKQRKDISTTPARISLEDMPTSPLAYCMFDQLFIADEALSELNQRQLEAIGQWVKAGGAVCVKPSYNVDALESRHIDFLNGLVDVRLKSGEMVEPYRLSAERKLEIGLFGEETEDVLMLREIRKRVGLNDAWKDTAAIRLYRPGFGRAVILTGDINLDDKDVAKDWTNAVGFMWRIRGNQIDAIHEQGSWRVTHAVDPVVDRLLKNNYYYRQQFQMRRQTGRNGSVNMVRPNLPLTGEIVNSLMPKSIRVIPFWVIICILSAFVIVIGPVDYLVLGYFKCRRYTWVLFPLVSVGFTGFTVYLSNQYMGSEDHRHALKFVDLGTQGEVLRSNSFELTFAARQSVDERDHQNVTFTPLRHEHVGRHGRGHMDVLGTQMITTEGRYPSRYQTSQQLKQWSPQLNRIMSIGPDSHTGDPLAVDWSSIQRLSDYSALLDRSDLGLYAVMVIPSANEVTVKTNGRGARFNPRQDDALFTIAGRRLTGDWFTVVNQISPTIGSHMEDLAILDSNNKTDHLVLMFRDEGDDTVVYRKLHTVGDE